MMDTDWEQAEYEEWLADNELEGDDEMEAVFRARKAESR